MSKGALSRDDVRRLEVAVMFAELDPARALEEACFARHQQRNADQRERHLFKRNGAVRPRGRPPGIPVTIGDTTQTLSAWCRHYGIHRNVVEHRIKKGMSVEQALIKPTRHYVPKGLDTRLVTIDGETRSFAAWTRHFKIHRNTAITRVERGLSLLDALTMDYKRKPRPGTSRLRLLRDVEEPTVPTPPPAAPPTIAEQFEAQLKRAQHRARVRASAAALLAELTPEERMNVLADLLVAESAE